MFGSFRWRDAHRLLVLPLAEDGYPLRLWEYDTLQSGEMQRIAHPLTDPPLTPLRIANGDWSVSPDGTRIVFDSSADHNLRVLILPGNYR